ncbi:MAG: hypothetical protein COV36_05345 [Alphaproteobacteria bacterium CG11_big_fil_rev_8_21_14_0_20_44_7]|nr:MAG: hypothetical protein COV36_05345 [Alphaproteobacteria bacterium CG11_big_fil_rev_8_21_14_0_20_44_7]
MQIIFNPALINDKCVIALGNFDGVHLGHKAIVQKTVELAKEKQVPAAVMTFEPHPMHLFRKDKLPIRLTPLKAKIALLEREGIERVYIMKFNRSFAEISAEDFISRFLANCHVVTGSNFGFGKGRSGDERLLKAKLGENYTQITEISQAGEVYSSSLIRKALKSGDVEAANKLLGHIYYIDGKVIGGAKLGEGLGYPTANIKLKAQMLRPKYGVYAVETNFGAGVANFGLRPTIDGKTELLEVHIFDFAENIYGQDLRVNLLAFIREEKHFENIEALKEQIGKDAEAAKAIIRSENV